MIRFGSVPLGPSAAPAKLGAPVVGIAATPDGKGYWLVTGTGKVVAYGSARHYGSPSASHLNQPIVGIVATADGQGYWLAARDGGVFSVWRRPLYGV